MRLQLTLTVPAGKRLIAKAIVAMPEVQRALQKGQLLLLGGTTVSALAEELGLKPLRISGRIDPSGSRTALAKSNAPHNLLLSQGNTIEVDDKLEDAVLLLDKKDLIITGANALDNQKQAAIAFAAPGGGGRGHALQMATVQGVPIIVACGLEKTIPGRIDQAIISAGRRKTDMSMGAAIGLYPLYGEVINELDAFNILFGLRATVIAAGGIKGAEGAYTFVLEGAKENIKEALSIVMSIKNAPTSGQGESLQRCVPGCIHCQRHMGCIYYNECLGDT